MNTRATVLALLAATLPACVDAADPTLDTTDQAVTTAQWSDWWVALENFDNVASPEAYVDVAASKTGVNTFVEQTFGVDGTSDWAGATLPDAPVLTTRNVLAGKTHPIFIRVMPDDEPSFTGSTFATLRMPQRTIVLPAMTIGQTFGIPVVGAGAGSHLLIGNQGAAPLTDATVSAPGFSTTVTIPGFGVASVPITGTALFQVHSDQALVTVTAVITHKGGAPQVTIATPAN